MFSVNNLYVKIFPTPFGLGLLKENKEVLSVTDIQGQKKIKSFQTTNKVIFWHFPFARGLQFFFCGIYFLWQCFADCFCLRFGEKQPKLKARDYIIFAISFVLGVAFSAGCLGFLPAILGYWCVGYAGSTFLRNLLIAIFRVVFLVLFVICLRLFSQVTEMFRFNYAAQKLLNEEKNKKKVFSAPNFLNFLVFVVLLDVIVITLCGASFGIFFNFLFHVAVLILSICVGYEILMFIQNFVPILTWATGFLVLAKPTRTHFETAMVAIEEMKMLQKGREFMNDENKRSFAVVYANAKQKLENAGITDKSDADWIIATILGKTRGEIKVLSSVTEKQYQDIMKAIERRVNGESVDNIFGYTEFYGMRFDVNKKVLTPRMETELLVEQVLKAEKGYKKCSILDVGTGSGAIAIAIAKNCDAVVTAVDVSKSALSVAENNAKKNDAKVEFLHSNLFDGLKRKRKFDIIVSNPPYIPTREIEKLDKNVKECDPVLALDGGEDGLDFYRTIISQAPSRLNPKGKIFFEVGKGQAVAVKKLLRENGFEEIKTIKDYSKIERIVSGSIK